MIWIIGGVIGFICCVLIIYKVYKMVLRKQLLSQFGIYVESDMELELTKEYLKTMKDRDIDEIVYNDLELDKVFKFINHTYTDVGKEYMYAQIFKSDIEPKKFEALISNWDDKDKLKKVLYELHRLSKQYSECLDLFTQMKTITSNDLIVMSSSFVVLLGIIGASFFVGFDILLFVFLWFAGQMGLYSHLTTKTDDVMSKAFSYCELVHSLDVLSSFGIYSDDDNKRIKAMVDKAKKYTFLHRMCVTIEKVDIFYFMEFFKGMFFIPYYQCVILKKHKNELMVDLFSMYKYIGVVDTSLSIYGLRMNCKTCIPQEISLPQLNFKDCYHPILKEPVKNSFTTNESCIITGTNASGKSTFLKTVGINMVMARTFHTCFASEFDYYPFQLCSSIHMKDDLDSGDSYYVKEIKVMKHILDLSKEKVCLIFIDEILRGTNEKERIAISRAVLSQLFHSQSLVLVTTHDLDLVESFQDIQQYCFHDDVKDNMLYCDYTIKKGICKVGNAIKLLEVHGYDKEILDQLKEAVTSK
ncbi:MAG: hypothetical protein RR630_08445 [Coprobacillus sp.]